MEEVIRKEMGVFKWLSKITERLNIIQLSIKERIEIREEDWDIIRDMHRFHELGYMPIYENILINKEETSQSVTQTNLFSDNSDTTAEVEVIGIEVANTPVKTKKTKKK